MKTQPIQPIEKLVTDNLFLFPFPAFIFRFILFLLFIIGFCNYSNGQTATIFLNYTGTTGINCGGENTYSASNGSVTFSGGIPAGAIISNIGVSANLGQLGASAPNFAFTLNGTAIGNINGVSATCQNNTFNASTVASYINTGSNSLAFTTSGTGTRGVYNITLTVTYCTPPGAPTVTTPVNYCQNVTAIPLTATGSGLLWYIGPTGGTGSSTAPTPLTTIVGTTSYYVSQTVGCEGPRAKIDVVVRALPVSSVTGQTNITCFAASDGTITVSASGGTGPYTFSVDNGANFLGPTGTNLRVFTGLLPNNPYRIKVKDNTGCVSK